MFGVKKGVDDKTMLEGPYGGKSKKGKTPQGFDIEFKVSENLVGIFPLHNDEKKLQKGMFIDMTISVTGATKKDFETIKVIQLVKYYYRNASDGDNGQKFSYETTRADRAELAGWKENTPKSKGWAVDFGNVGDDKNKKFTAFYINGSNWDFNEGSPTRPAELIDAPSWLNSSKRLGKEFETYAIGINSKGQMEFLGGLKWGFYISINGKTVSGEPNSLELIENPLPELGHALGRWNRVQNIKNAEPIKSIKGVVIE
jgi:hypothetical protein